MARVGSETGVKLEAYGKLTQIAVEPIEKKPIWHYRPGLRVLSLGGWGCNFACNYCQNWMVSQRDDAPKKDMSPDDVALLALARGCGGICFTYNEPIVYFEYVMDVARRARSAGLDLILKTNAYAEPAPWKELVDATAAMNIDWKGTNERYRKVARADDGVIFDRIADAVDGGCHVEISVPVYHDSRVEEYSEFLEFCSRFPNVPIHLLKIFPANRTTHYPITSNVMLFRLQRMLRKLVNYVYIANVFSDDVSRNTSCASCNSVLVERTGIEPIVRIEEPCCEGCPITI